MAIGVVVDAVVFVTSWVDDVVVIADVDDVCDDVIFVDIGVLGCTVVVLGVVGFSCILLKSTGVISRSILIFTWSNSISNRSTNAMLDDVSFTLGADVSITAIMSRLDASFSTKNKVKLMCLSLKKQKNKIYYTGIIITSKC